MPSSGAEMDIAVKRALTQSEWLNKSNYDEAESNYQRHLAKVEDNSFGKVKKENSLVTEGKSSLVDEIARTRQQIKHSLQSCELNEDLKTVEKSSDMSTLLQRLAQVEIDNKKLHTVIEKLQADQRSLESRFAVLEKSKGNQVSKTEPKVAEAKKSESKDDADDDVDLFASEEEDEAEREALHNQRVKAYEEKKSKKAVIIAKSNIILDIKPWDDETDMKNMEASVRTIQMDGLVWGAAKLMPLAYGIFKLQISCVVEDDKVSVDDLQEKIEGFEELVQSVDIAAFNKV